MVTYRSACRAHVENTMAETWKRFKNTTYSVSSTGYVYNEYSGKILKPFPNNNGYLTVDLFHNTVKERISLHRLVAITFIPNLENKPFVNHIDGNKQNNCVDNLEWCTPSENSKHAIDIGLVLRGEDKSTAKLTEKDVLEIQTAFEEGVKDFILAKRYNVSSGVISAIRLGRSWKHVSGKVFRPSGPNPVKKLTAEDIPVIRQYFKDGLNDAEIARKYNIARGTINQIRQGKTWINY